LTGSEKQQVLEVIKESLKRNKYLLNKKEQKRLDCNEMILILGQLTGLVPCLLYVIITGFSKYNLCLAAQPECNLPFYFLNSFDIIIAPLWFIGTLVGGKLAQKYYLWRMGKFYYPYVRLLLTEISELDLDLRYVLEEHTLEEIFEKLLKESN
jgi:hypothetical protein